MPSVDVEKEQEGAPVTQDDLRTLRRWIVVAGVWAVAATVVALIALLDDSGRAAERRANETGRRSPRASSASTTGWPGSSAGWTRRPPPPRCSSCAPRSARPSGRLRARRRT